MAGAVYGISGTLRCLAELCVRSLQARESHLFHCQESPFRTGCRFGRRISSNGTILKANSLFSINSFSSFLDNSSEEAVKRVAQLAGKYGDNLTFYKVFKLIILIAYMILEFKCLRLICCFMFDSVAF